MFRKTNILRNFAGKSWGVINRDLFHIYKAWILPNIEHCSLIFCQYLTQLQTKYKLLKTKLLDQHLDYPETLQSILYIQIAQKPKIKEHIT